MRTAVEALVADERAKNHTIRADRLLVQLQSGNGRHGRQTPLLSRSASGPLVANPVLVRSLSDLILSSAAEEAVTELVAEQHRAGLMRLCSLEPRNRVLLAAPPGNGKTNQQVGHTGPMHSGNIGTPLALLPSAPNAYTEPCGGGVSVEIAGNSAPVEVFE